MKLTTDQALQEGVAAHREGKFQDAERLYRGILQVQPNHPDANHNLGVLAVAVGKPSEAAPLFKRALDTNPQVEQFWLSYIDVLIRLEHFDEATRALVEGERAGVSLENLDAFKQRLQGSPSGSEPSQDQINHLMEHYQAGRLGEAESLAASLAQQFPKHAFAWKILGVVLKQAGRLDESLLPMQKAVEFSPRDAEAHHNVGLTLMELGALEGAEASYRRAVSLKPDYVEAHCNLGAVLLAMGSPGEAEASYKQAISLRPDYAEAHSNLGAVFQELGMLVESEASHKQAILLNPDFAAAHSNLGVTLQQLGRLEESEKSLRQALVLKPDYAQALYNRGNTLQELGRLDESETSYRESIALKPDYAPAHNNLGNTLKNQGRLEEAEASYRQAIELKPDYAEAHRAVTTIKRFSSQDEQFRQMQALYRDTGISEDARCYICFALAKASEDLEDWAAAFQFYLEGNALQKKQLGYERAEDKKLFERLKANHPRVAAYSLGSNNVASEHAPIFIVGMPRSGTTLVEQIISSHPLVTGAGELSFVSQFGFALATGQTPADRQALTTFRDQYLKALQRCSQGNAVVIDKMPHNFRFLGLITAALPEAKIVHVERYPAAVCWANFTQRFQNGSLSYSYGLDDIVHYHELYQDLMRYWRLALPGRIYDLDYEVLTEHQEQETRRLIGHLGLQWDDACLSPQHNKRSVATASNAQIRQEVYRGSSEKWKRYRPYLNGVLDHFCASDIGAEERT